MFLHVGTVSKPMMTGLRMPTAQIFTIDDDTPLSITDSKQLQNSSMVHMHRIDWLCFAYDGRQREQQF